MINSIFNALSGMVAATQRLQNSASNLVNLGRDQVTVTDNSGIRSDLSLTAASKVDISKEALSQMTSKAEFIANAKVIAVADETIGTILDVKS